jgi:hypothetical protein
MTTTPNVTTDFHVRLEGRPFQDLSREEKVALVVDYLTRLRSDVSKDTKVNEAMRLRALKAHRRDHFGIPVWASPKMLLPWVKFRNR